MNEITLDFKELDNFVNDMLVLINDKYPKESKQFLRKASRMLATRTRKNYRSKVRKITGNLFKGLKSGKVYKYGGNEWHVRVYNNAYHAHLIEYDHVHGNRYGSKGGHIVKGKHILKNSSDDFENEFYSMAEKFVEQVIEKGVG